MGSPLAELSRNTLADIERLVSDERQRQGGVERAYNMAFGDVNYDLQRPAKQTEVYYFPILNMMPHVAGNGGPATNYKIIDKINTGNIEGWVPEGARQQQIQSHLLNASAAYATFGLEDSITDEAKTGATGFEDAMARMQTNLLLETQRRLEKAVSFANANLALGTPTAPTVADVGTGGTIPQTTTVRVAVIALTPYGLEASSVAGGVVQPVNVTGPDGKTVTNGYGASAISASTSVTTATDGNATHSLTATTPVVLGAAGYAWFVGPDTTHLYLMAITQLNSAKLVAVGNAANQEGHLFTTDYSKASNTFGGITTTAFDGLLALAYQYGTVINQATGTPGIGTGLTADGAGGIVEIETLLQTLWDNTKVSPKVLVMSSQEMKNIRTKTISGGAAPLFRFNIDGGSASPITAGRVVGSYLNVFTVGGGQLITLILHPYCPKGTILAFTDSLPGELIPNSNVGQLFEFHMPSAEDDIHATQWPRISREYRTGVYIRGAVAHYFPATMGVITNIGNT